MSQDLRDLITVEAPVRENKKGRVKVLLTDAQINAQTQQFQEQPTVASSMLAEHLPALLLILINDFIISMVIIYV